MFINNTKGNLQQAVVGCISYVWGKYLEIIKSALVSHLLIDLQSF